MCLPKYESILRWAYIHPDSLINYPWEHWHDYVGSRGWNTKWRAHCPYNGKKPKWRKQERRFKESQKSEVINLAKHSWISPSTIETIVNTKFKFRLGISEDSVVTRFLFESDLDYLDNRDKQAFLRIYNRFMDVLREEIGMSEIVESYANIPAVPYIAKEIEAVINSLIRVYEDENKLDIKEIFKGMLGLPEHRFCVPKAFRGR